MQVICDSEHITECRPDTMPTECSVCGSRRLTYIVGELKDDNGGVLGKKDGVTQISFKRTGRMEELDQKYGNRF